ncbi:LON peptidase substrate-binding domain-containing protein [Massilia sp. YIM B02763]|uniref:LON peptidase substrate-binding domain-containing protein n=1 Tax=Massilia sp. YIM B02763 TaxID=3050130 RepID=UPI0025B62E32|nr:LON peptidase substrate-binding domain-containing protein [Massilia sp. YIM B02763]MDN4054656.1 LON peptidase substrate-binding domain-containing protein [Massilia sp. YIM B02763]
MATISIPLFPLSTVLFPDGVLPLQIFEVRYLDMIGRCLAEDEPFGVVLLTQGQEVRTPEGVEQFAGTGTLATVTDTTASAPGLLQVVCRGGSRFRVMDSERRADGLWMAEASMLEDDHAVRIPSDLKGAADALDRVLASLHDVPESRWPVQPPFRLDDCGWVSNRWCELLPLPNVQKQQMLMLDNPMIRLELLHDVLDEHGLITS